jgi:hypothetical protein
MSQYEPEASESGRYAEITATAHDIEQQHGFKEKDDEPTVIHTQSLSGSPKIFTLYFAIGVIAFDRRTHRSFGSI